MKAGLKKRIKMRVIAHTNCAIFPLSTPPPFQFRILSVTMANDKTVVLEEDERAKGKKTWRTQNHLALKTPTFQLNKNVNVNEHDEHEQAITIYLI